MKEILRCGMIPLVIVILFSSTVYAEVTKKDSVPKKISEFLKVVENWPWDVDSLASSLIIDKKINKNILECREGIFSIITLSTSTYTHFILINKDSSLIINMRDPIEKNIEILLCFLKNNRQYSREDIIFYITDMIRTYDSNENDYLNHIKR
jgi:hypothetical protein